MSIYDGVVSWWTLNETSGERSDSMGLDDLSEQFDTVASASGKVGNAAAIQMATGEFLQSSANFPYALNEYGVDGNQQMSIACWVKVLGAMPVVPSSATIVTNAAISGLGQYALLVGDSSAQWIVQYDGTAFVSSSLTATDWNLLIVTVDTATKQVKMSLNGAAFTAGTIGTGSLSTSKDYFKVVADEYYEGPTVLVDELVVWDRILTDQDAADLYNGGDGVTFQDPAVRVAVHLPQPSIPSPPAAVAVVGLTQPELVQAVCVQSHLVAPPVPEPDAARARVVLPIPAAPPAAHVEVHLSDPSVESPEAIRAQANLPAPSVALDAIQVDVTLSQIGYEILVSSITSISYAAAGDITSASFSQADILNIEYRASGF